MPRKAQMYVTGLLTELLGSAEKEKRFDWCRGDSRDQTRHGRTLPFDAVWEARKLIVEIDERQHSEPVAFFDKRMTVSGVPRGEQRRRYDERKARLAREHGYTMVRISAAALSSHGRKLAMDRGVDLPAIRTLLKAHRVRISQPTDGAIRPRPASRYD
jgi:very-short-patch-repair endonuclease